MRICRRSFPSAVLLLLAQQNICAPLAISQKTPLTGPTPLSLPEPYATPSSTSFSKLIGWPPGKHPVAPPGFKVQLFASGLDYPRWLYVLPNGDVLVAEARTEMNLPSAVNPQGSSPEVSHMVQGLVESGYVGKSADRITLLRDTNGDGIAEQKYTLLDRSNGLHQQMGMALRNGTLYVADTDGIVTFPYTSGQTHITAYAKKILELPAGGYNNHWNRNIVNSPDGKTLFVTVGSGSNVGENGVENEQRRADILEITPDGSSEQVYASGLRNPQGIDWEPLTGKMFTVVNERDQLGDNLVPDFLTSIRKGGFYGWPYSYFGQHVDPRHHGEHPEFVAKAIEPDYSLGPHTASLGLAFYRGTTFPQHYRGGAFVGQHGSWNRSEMTGYQVGYVQFVNGKPTGELESFLTGFIADRKARTVYGRPVAVVMLRDGSLLVADDAGGCVWRVSYSPLGTR